MHCWEALRRLCAGDDSCAPARSSACVRASLLGHPAERARSTPLLLIASRKRPTQVAKATVACGVQCDACASTSTPATAPLTTQPPPTDGHCIQPGWGPAAGLAAFLCILACRWRAAAPASVAQHLPRPTLSIPGGAAGGAAAFARALNGPLRDRGRARVRCAAGYDGHSCEPKPRIACAGWW